MKHAMKSVRAAHLQSSARVVDGKLILSFPQALTPVVWQMDLNQAKASALEVREDKTAATFVLTLKTPRGESTEIAPFETREQAVTALMAVSRALETAQGHIRPVSMASGASTITVAQGGESGRRQGRAGKWAAAILGLVFLFLLINIWGSLLPRSPSGFEGAALRPASEGMDNVESGVPLSADDVLGKP